MAWIKGEQEQWNRLKEITGNNCYKHSLSHVTDTECQIQNMFLGRYSQKFKYLAANHLSRNKRMLAHMVTLAFLI